MNGDVAVLLKLLDYIIAQEGPSSKDWHETHMSVGDVREAASTIRALVVERDEAIILRNDMQAAVIAMAENARAAHDIWCMENPLRKAAEAKVTEQAAEIERLRGEAKIEAALLSEWMAANAELEAKLREAVEVMHAMREETATLIARYDDHEQSNHPNAYVMLQRIAAFLATMEKTDG